MARDMIKGTARVGGTGATDLRLSRAEDYFVSRSYRRLRCGLPTASATFGAAHRVQRLHYTGVFCHGFRKEKMRLAHAFTVPLSAAILVATGCASGPVAVPPDVPAPLRPPAGQSIFLKALASGVQIYECTSKPDQPPTFEWVFRAPEAALVDRSGRSIGKHYAGPTWESVDGSTVVGEVKSRDPGPIPSSIPWLLLTVESTTGTGVFSQTKSIQRLQTVGGIAPSEPCTSANFKQVARVPYTATYYFYRAAP